jgi:hypothetical protein
MKTLRHSEDVNEILRRLQALRPSSERQWGRMSVQQMVCHLKDGFLLYMGEKNALPVRTLAPRRLLKWFALWVPIPWPHGFKTFPELDQELGGTRPAEFDSDVDTLRALIKRFTGSGKDFKWPETHPHFGLMSEADWQRLGYLHTNHHFRQFGC